MVTLTARESTRQKTLNKRLDALAKHDRELLLTLDNCIIAGVDEVGRGSLIGPVVAASVVFPASVIKKPPKALMGLDDSKATHLNHEIRTTLAKVIQEHALVCAVAEATQQEVETLNVSQASLLAGKRALLKCLDKLNETSSVLALMDGRQPLRGLQHPQFSLSSQAIVKGDSKSLSIAAASVLAKVYRDNWVLELCSAEPELEKYGFKTNMGYATPPHRKAIILDGACKYHRQTFLGKILSEQLILKI